MTRPERPRDSPVAVLQIYEVPEVMQMLKMSRTVFFEQLRAGRLRSVRQGRARLIPASAVAEYIALLEPRKPRGTRHDRSPQGARTCQRRRLDLPVQERLRGLSGRAHSGGWAEPAAVRT